MPNSKPSTIMLELMERPIDPINTQRLCRAFTVDAPESLPTEVVQAYWEVALASDRAHLNKSSDAFFLAVIARCAIAADAVPETFKTLVRRGDVTPDDPIQFRLREKSKWEDGRFRSLSNDEVQLEDAGGTIRHIPYDRVRPVEMVPA